MWRAIMRSSSVGITRTGTRERGLLMRASPRALAASSSSTPSQRQPAAVLVSSANTSNRSMGLDTELGLAWETEEPHPALRRARLELLGEHCGLGGAEAEAVLAEPAGLVGRLDAMARARSHRLRLHPMDDDQEPALSIAKALREDSPLDPDGPIFEDLMPEPDAWTRHWRE